jgi:hypothetical protein
MGKGRTGLIRFLGYVDYQGTTYESPTIATGYGAYIAQPLLRKAVEGKEDTLTEEEAAKILDDAMRVLFYIDARSLNNVESNSCRFNALSSLLLDPRSPNHINSRPSGVSQILSVVMVQYMNKSDSVMSKK